MHACWAYTLLILYGSWFPFSHLISPARPLFSFLVTEPSYDRADLIQNLLIYMPLGLFMVAWLNASRRFGPALACATLTGTLLSFTVESVQQFLPERVASLSDLVLNAVGTWVGGWLAIFVSRDTLTGKKMLSYRNHVFREGAMVNVAIAVLGLWVLSQTSPLVPSLDPAHLRHGFAMLKQSYQHPERFDLLKFSIYSSYVLALGLLAVSAVRADRSAFGLFAGVVGAVLVGKVLVVTRQLAAEALLGALTACIVLLPLRRLSGGWLSLIGMTAILSGFAVFELALALLGCHWRSTGCRLRARCSRWAGWRTSWNCCGPSWRWRILRASPLHAIDGRWPACLAVCWCWPICLPWSGGSSICRGGMATSPRWRWVLPAGCCLGGLDEAGATRLGAGNTQLDLSESARMPRYIAARVMARFTRSLWAGAVALSLLACQRPPQAIMVASLPWALNGQWMVVDVHSHTSYSDGSLSPGDLVKLARESGCQGLAITDHADASVKGATPEYFADIGRWRDAYPDMVLLAGLEWNVPPYAGANMQGCWSAVSWSRNCSRNSRRSSMAAKGVPCRRWSGWPRTATSTRPCCSTTTPAEKTRTRVRTCRT